MEEVKGQHEDDNKQSNDKEENKGLFAILLLQLLQPYAATFGNIKQNNCVHKPKFVIRILCFHFNQN